MNCFYLSFKNWLAFPQMISDSQMNTKLLIFYIFGWIKIYRLKILLNFNK